MTTFLRQLPGAPAWCSTHQFCAGAVYTDCGPGAAHTNSVLVLSAPILAWCSPYQFWPGAANTNSDPVPPAPILACYSPHLCLPSTVCIWLSNRECTVYVGYNILQSEYFMLSSFHNPSWGWRTTQSSRTGQKHGTNHKIEPQDSTKQTLQNEKGTGGKAVDT